MTSTFDALPFDLKPMTRWMGHPLFFMREIDSTNRLLRQLAHQGSPEGTVLLTDYQLAGRGRRGRDWTAPPATSLLSSHLLRFSQSTLSLSLLPLLVSVAVARTLENHLALAPVIKWPNDILLDGRKCCGILIESEWENGQLTIMVGIGLNVNQEEETFQSLPYATSLKCVTGQKIARGPLFAALLHELEKAYDHFRAGWLPHDAWRQRAPWLVGQPITIYPSQPPSYRATALDLAHDGALLIQHPNGNQVRLHAGEVSVRPELQRG